MFIQFEKRQQNKEQKGKEKKVNAYGIGLTAAKEEEPGTEVGKPRAGEEKAQEGKSASSKDEICQQHFAYFVASKGWPFDHERTTVLVLWPIFFI
ncbi:hypothetical protein G6F38_013551 [Rhizopus arrhizus]|nr:hypothetical protein G6F38_013551 [Rhizopus arrhizus]